MIKQACVVAAAMAAGAVLAHGAFAVEADANSLFTPIQDSTKAWDGDPVAPGFVLDVCRNGPQVHHNFGWAQSEALIGQGWTAVDEQRGEDAVRDFMTAIHVGPLRPEPYWGMGVAAHVAGFGDEVIDACFGRAIAMIPDVPAVRAEYGDVLALRERWDEAIAAYESALDLDETYIYAHERLSAALLMTGNIEGAKAHRERADSLRAGNE